MQQIKALYFLYPMRYGGIEIWVRDIIKHVSRNRLGIDLWVLGGKEVLEDEVRAKGVRITHYDYLPPNPFTMIRSLWQTLSATQYDVVHCHYRHANGLFLLIAAIKGVPIRIAHSHNDMRAYDAKKSLLKRGYLALMQILIKLCATHGLAASDGAARSLFGENYEKDPRWQVFFCGLDLSGFQQPIKPELRTELGLKPKGQGLVIGHVGRFEEQKNHRFIIEIFKQLSDKDKNAQLVLVGDGAKRQEIETYVEESGLSNNVIFCGRRNDIPAILRSSIDVFLFPSLYEGLGLAAVEAQAAGVPCVIADVIPKEADVVDGMVTRLSLSDSPVLWADSLIMAAHTHDAVRQRGYESVAKSDFNIENRIEELLTLYEVRKQGVFG